MEMTKPRDILYTLAAGAIVSSSGVVVGAQARLAG